MTLLPIVARELRVASRRGGTYWTRFTAASLAIAVGAFAWLTFFRHSPRETGFWIFVWLSVIAFLHSLLSGALSTADCLSEEKREGTLGLLFLTDLKSYDIVLGKLAASSVATIYGLLAIFPIMGIPLLLGGVAPGEFWRVVIVCANNLFLSLTIGMLLSALCKDDRKAIGLTMTTLILLTIAVPGIVLWISTTISPPHPLYHLFHERPYPLLVFSPGFACVFAFDDPRKQMMVGGGIDWFYVSLGVIHALAWLALILTTIVVPHVWQDKAATKGALRRRERWQQWTLGGPASRAAFRRRLLDINPFYWLTSRERFKVALVWFWMAIGALFWFVGLVREKQDWLNEGIYICTALLTHSSLKCWLAMEASRRLGADRRSGALELLLSTPLRVNEILRGQWLALLRQFGAAAALVCAVDFIFLGHGLNHATGFSGRSFWIGLWLVGIVVFIFDLATLAPVTMWLSLKGRKANRAGTNSLLLVCGLPWLVFGGLCAALALVEELTGFRGLVPSSSEFFLGAWFVLSILNNVFLGAWSLNNLHTKFRLVATQRMESRATFWGRLFGQRAATK